MIDGRRSLAGGDGHLTPFIGRPPRCYRARVSAVSLCSASYRISGAESHALNDPSVVESVLRDAAREAGLTVVSGARHRFDPQGVSVVVILSESHIAAHTWPESGTAYVTLTSCRELDGATAEAIGALLVRTLRAESAVTGMVVL